VSQLVTFTLAAVAVCPCDAWWESSRETAGAWEEKCSGCERPRRCQLALDFVPAQDGRLISTATLLVQAVGVSSATVMVMCPCETQHRIPLTYRELENARPWRWRRACPSCGHPLFIAAKLAQEGPVFGVSVSVTQVGRTADA